MLGKYTPGPWVIGKVGDTGYSDQTAPCHIWTSKGPGRGLVATTNPHCQPTEQNRIDAILIAAAPELYQLALNIRNSFPSDHPALVADASEILKKLEGSHA